MHVLAFIVLFCFCMLLAIAFSGGNEKGFLFRTLSMIFCLVSIALSIVALVA